MAYTQTIDEAAPLGGANANTADDEFRNLKRDIKERMNTLVNDWQLDPLTLKSLNFSGQASPKIISGSTNLLFRNAADSATNLEIENTFGHATVRGTLTASAFFGLVNAIDLTIQDSLHVAYYVVSAGAVDSGGAGFRVLRVGNAFTP